MCPDSAFTNSPATLAPSSEREIHNYTNMKDKQSTCAYHLFLVFIKLDSHPMAFSELRCEVGQQPIEQNCVRGRGDCQSRATWEGVSTRSMPYLRRPGRLATQPTLAGVPREEEVGGAEPSNTRVVAVAAPPSPSAGQRLALGCLAEVAGRGLLSRMWRRRGAVLPPAVGMEMQVRGRPTTMTREIRVWSWG